jgi:hypothetical protein
MKPILRKTCRCHFCAIELPVIRAVEKQLPPKLRGKFDLLMQQYECERMDASADAAKLAGQWPGWEWLPGEIAKRRKQPPPAQK